jgi:hypothetical protein
MHTAHTLEKAEEETLNFRSFKLSDMRRVDQRGQSAGPRVLRLTQRAKSGKDRSPKAENESQSGKSSTHLVISVNFQFQNTTWRFLFVWHPLGSLMIGRMFGAMACYGVCDTTGCVLYVTWNTNRIINPCEA